MVQSAEVIEQELERVAKMVGIPPCPAILADLSAEVKKPEPDFHHIERLFCSDVALAAALVQTINSPFCGFPNKAATVVQAVNSIGLNALSRVVAGMALRNTFDGICTISMERFNDASAKVALAAAYLAQELGVSNRDEAYTYGLFQDCGIPVLMARYPDYKATLGVANKTADRKFTAIEDNAYATNHAVVGCLMAKNWGLQDNITEAIRYHHEYAMLGSQDIATASQHLIGLGLMAERAIQLDTGLNNSMEWSKGGAVVLDMFKLTQTEFERLVEGVSEVFELEGLSCRHVLDDNLTLQ